MALMEDLLDQESDTKETIRYILCDYIPYAKYSSYWNILFESYNTAPALYYGIFEDTVVENIDSTREKAIKLLYNKCKEEFSKIFIQFTSNRDSFSKIDKHLKVDFIETDIYPRLLSRSMLVYDKK